MAWDHRLRILSGTQTKQTDPLLLPALERYDGPMFRVLRKFLRQGSSREGFVHQTRNTAQRSADAGKSCILAWTIRGT